MSNRCERKGAIDGASQPLTLFTTHSARLSITSTNAHHEYHFQQALRRSGKRLAQTRTDTERQKCRQSNQQAEVHSPKAHTDTRPESCAEPILLPSTIRASALVKISPPSNTHALIARCIEAIHQNIQSDIRRTTIEVKLPDSLFDGARILIHRSSTGWLLEVNGCSERHRRTLQRAMPELRRCFRAQQFGEITYMDRHLDSGP